MNKKEFYVYVHKRKTDSSVFYVGKGKGSRDSSRSGRSNHWRNIVEKNGLIIERLAENLSESEAYQLEIQFIKEMRILGERICNIANGGNGGLSGIKLNPDHIEKLRNAKIGKPQSPDHAKKSARAKIGKMVKNKRKPVINSDGAIFKSASDAAREVGGSQGNISMAARGERLEAYGQAWSYDISKKPDPPSPVKTNMKRVICSNGQAFNSTQEATRWVRSWRGSANNQCITACARGQSVSAYGFTWRYEP